MLVFHFLQVSAHITSHQTGLPWALCIDEHPPLFPVPSLMPLIFPKHWSPLDIYPIFTCNSFVISLIWLECQLHKNRDFLCFAPCCSVSLVIRTVPDPCVCVCLKEWVLCRPPKCLPPKSHLGVGHILAQPLLGTEGRSSCITSFHRQLDRLYHAPSCQDSWALKPGFFLTLCEGGRR